MEPKSKKVNDVSVWNRRFLRERESEFMWHANTKHNNKQTWQNRTKLINLSANTQTDKKIGNFFSLYQFFVCWGSNEFIASTFDNTKWRKFLHGGKTWSKGMIISKYLGVENKCVSTYVMAIEGIPPSNSDNM